MNCIITKFTFYLGKVKMPSWTIWRYFLHIALISDFFAMFVGSALFLNWSFVNPVENTKTIHTRISRSSTRIIFKIFLRFIIVYSQMMKIRKWLSTRITFKISLIFINGFHQIDSLSKWFSTRATNEIFLIFVNGFYSPSNCICYIKIFTMVTNISIFVNGFYSSSNCTCYIKIFTKVTNISNETHVVNHWHQLSSKPFT